MVTLVVDTGQDIVGVYSVEDDTYTPYRGKEIAVALERIRQADELVTYNGNAYDMKELAKFDGQKGNRVLQIQGVHSDMRSICWSDRIWGKSLGATYCKHFGALPDFPDTYEGCNQSDVYMTFKLWDLWRRGELRILDGDER